MTTRGNILLIDDDNAFLQVASMILARKGFSATTCRTAADATSEAQKKAPNVAVIDLGLPDGEGTDLIPVLLGIDPDLIAIVLTGRSSLRGAVQALNSGAFAFLEKPLDPDQLISVIDRGIEKQRLTTENRRLLEELEIRNRETGLLLNVSQALSRSLDTNETIAAAMPYVLESLRADISHLHVLESGVLRLQRLQGRPGFDVDNALSHLAPILERVLKSNEATIIQTRNAECEAADISYVGAPLISRDGPFGVFGVGCSGSRSFSSRDRALLEGIATEISIALQNAHLYEEASSARSLRQLDRFRTEFLANVSHELRTPLSVIKGSASTLLERDVTFDRATQEDFLKTIDEESDRLNRLIEDLLTMSRLEAGCLHLRKEARRPDQIVGAIRSRLEKIACKHDLAIDIPVGLPHLLADEFRIGQVMTNLVENACKFSPVGAGIEVGAEDKEETVTFCVSDRGKGVPSQFRDRIFERFYQIQQEESVPRKGTGLGLPICRAIIESHGGSIWVEGREGGGARFCFALPKK